jgi:hypothetical protein
MAKKIQHKRGDLFSYYGELDIDGDKDFTGWSIAAKIRESKGTLIANLSPFWVDAVNGIFGITQATTEWPLAPKHDRALMDIELTSPSGAPISSPTVLVEIVGDQTYG